MKTTKLFATLFAGVAIALSSSASFVGWVSNFDGTEFGGLTEDNYVKLTDGAGNYFDLYETANDAYKGENSLGQSANLLDADDFADGQGITSSDVLTTSYLYANIGSATSYYIELYNSSGDVLAYVPGSSANIYNVTGEEIGINVNDIGQNIAVANKSLTSNFVIPEPTSVTLLVFGLCALGLRRRVKA